MQVLFSHGQESGPWGTKIQRLARTATALGWQVDSIDYRDLPDPDARSERLLQRLGKTDAGSTVLLGSSMGGYVTLQAAARQAVLGSFVLAPAIYMPGYEHKAPQHTLANLAIVHGYADDIIPVEHSMRFAQAQRCTLHLVNDDHRLIASLPSIDAWFASYLTQLTR